MGEAKRRRENDTSFGKPKSGLVICAPISVGPGNRVQARGALDQQALRASLLYWDKLAWPTNNVYHVDTGSDGEFLIEAKVLSRPKVTLTGSGGFADFVVQGHERAFEQLDAESPGQWSLAQGENALLFDHGKLSEANGLAVELLSAIPVPDKDVPLNEILEFRLKRKDELRALREEIDSLLKRINESADSQEELKRCLKEIDEKSATAIRVCSEWQFPVRISNLKSSFDIKPFAVLRDSIIAYVGGHTLNASTAALATAIGAHAVSSVKISGDFGWVGLRDRSNPYRYVSQFHTEVF